MRIASMPGPSRAERRQALNRTASTGANAFSQSAARTQGATQAPVELAGAAPLASLGSIIAAQGAEDVEERHERARQHGSDTLDMLMELRDASLGLGATAYNPDRLRQLVETGYEATGDARLDSTLNEIDIRAAVELAKIDREV